MRVDAACAPADAKYHDVRAPLPDGGARANAPDFTVFRGVEKNPPFIDFCEVQAC